MTRSIKTMPAQRGFTLLEAIVALVVFCLVAVSLYAWQNANLIALQRAQAHRARNEAIRGALQIVETINPMQTPKGERDFGQWHVQWTSRPLQPARDGVSSVGILSAFKVGLYELQVQVLDHQQVVADFSTRQAGYQQVRTVETGL